MGLEEGFAYGRLPYVHEVKPSYTAECGGTRGQGWLRQVYQRPKVGLMIYLRPCVYGESFHVEPWSDIVGHD